MPDTLSIGKYRGMETTSSKNGIFTILALDHRQSFSKMINPASPDSVTYQDIVNVKHAFVSELGSHVTAVLLDPLFGAAQMISTRALPGTSGLLVAVESSGYTGDPTARHSGLLSGWDIAKVKRMGASAVKLLVYYHPGAGELAEQQEKLVAEVVEACKKEDIILFLEVVTYSINPSMSRSSAEFARQLPGIIEAIAHRMGAYHPEILKLEFPVNAEFDQDEASWQKACEGVSKASPCPWTVLSAGAEFELFCRQVEVACKAGASGFIAGRSVWKEGVSMPAGQREAWLREVAAPRMDRLCEIADRHARPWTDFFSAPAISSLEDWYKKY
jgi:tagatose 1,6-diphosphate aldolase